MLNQVVKELACGDTGRYGEIGWSRSSFGETWGDVGRRGEMWGDVGRCGEMWEDQVIKELTALDELHQQTELGLRLKDLLSLS